MRQFHPLSEPVRDDSLARGDTFLPGELVRLIRAAAPRRRRRDRSGPPPDPRRPIHTPDAADPSSETWTFGADPMLWARIRQDGHAEAKSDLDIGLRPGWLARILGFDPRGG